MVATAMGFQVVAMEALEALAHGHTAESHSGTCSNI
jgi:hypothetical protein